MISCLVRRRTLLDRISKRDTDENLQRYQRFCCKHKLKYCRSSRVYKLIPVFTPPKQGALSISWAAELKAAGLNTDCIFKSDNERALLSQFLAKFKQLDPDVIVVRRFKTKCCFKIWKLIYLGSRHACAVDASYLARRKVQSQNMELPEPSASRYAAWSTAQDEGRHVGAHSWPLSVVLANRRRRVVSESQLRHGRSFATTRAGKGAYAAHRDANYECVHVSLAFIFTLQTKATLLLAVC